MKLATRDSETLGRNSNRRRTLDPNQDSSSSTGRESLNQFVRRLYGEETCKQYQQLDNFRKQKAHLLATLAFLSRCRDTNIVPAFLRQKQILQSAQAKRIYARTEKAFLRERIHYTRHSLARTDEKLLGLHLTEQQDWDKMDAISHSNMRNQLDRFKVQQIRKYEKFQRRQSPQTASIDHERLVVNLTDRVLAEDEKSVLSKGGNFAITPRHIPVEDIISSTEAAIRHLPDEAAEEIRMATANILRRANPPKSKLVWYYGT
ncbi:unnamed protein product [Acanthoscelides obtectus]|uniref:Uncharacterized protein n=1 Tax=Acanthoscelides obtectus TaxID=200917 RepID=A0A9P0LIN4_ACAOB|nr:unnamed protein product [Acanthoscelides obtectus]CAK1658400.1 hypothetical protein AOBTE_LOCUS20862 [Acanthoscelides obtectus]